MGIFIQNQKRYEDRHAFRTYAEVDEAQLLELISILDRWKKGAVAWHVLLDTALTVNAEVDFLRDYVIARERAPGGARYDWRAQRRDYLARVRNLGKIVSDHVASLEADIKRDAKKEAAAQGQIIADIIDKRSHVARDVDRHSLIDALREPPKGMSASEREDYNTGLESLLAHEWRLTAAGRDLSLVRVWQTIEDIYLYRISVERNVDDLPSLQKAYRLNAKKGLTDEIKALKKSFRPEVLTKDRTLILDGISQLEKEIEGGNVDSWQVACAMAEMILGCESDKKPGSARGNTKAKAFIAAVMKAQAECRKRLPDLRSSYEQLRPKTQQDCQTELALPMARWAAYKNWRLGQEYSPGAAAFNSILGSGGFYNYDHFRHEFQSSGYPGVPTQEEGIAFTSPFADERAICSQIAIEPCGLRIIEPYARPDGYRRIDDGDRPVAEVTVYSVSFIPQTPEYLNKLANIISEALDSFYYIPGTFEIPERQYVWRNFRKVREGNDIPYRRPPWQGGASAEWQTGNVSIQNGQVVLAQPLDLDDIMRLYYIIEPVIQANAHVAAVVNHAMHVEERGPVLFPQYDYEYDKEFGYKPDTQHERPDRYRQADLLSQHLASTFSEFCTNQIDSLQLVHRVLVLAGHTLDEGIKDPAGLFTATPLLSAPTTPIPQGPDIGAKEMTPNECLENRARELLMSLLNSGMRSRQDIKDLNLVGLAEAAKMLHARAIRQNAEHQHKMQWAAKDAAERAFIDFCIERLQRLDGETEGQIDNILADINQQEQKALRQQLVRATWLPTDQSVVARATTQGFQIDQVLAGSAYRIKTNGGPSRYAIPTQLAPFIQRQDHNGVDRVILTLVAPPQARGGPTSPELL